MSVTWKAGFAGQECQAMRLRHGTECQYFRTRRRQERYTLVPLHDCIMFPYVSTCFHHCKPRQGGVAWAKAGWEASRRAGNGLSLWASTRVQAESAFSIRKLARSDPGPVRPRPPSSQYQQLPVFQAYLGLEHALECEILPQTHFSDLPSISRGCVPNFY